ncbi:MAG: hypothetical protein QOC96_752 [Acidobacteriota bacterium]|jgi:uncharacterized protein (DUF1800 family)|nr:hypothetical protein [Acidobacteriota bacterium]
MISAGDGQMSLIKFSRNASRSSALLRSLVLFLGLLLAFEPLAVLTISAQGRQARRNTSGTAQGLTEDQRIAHVLARLSFGARPGDFERVKAMGVNAYIEQQLDPDSIDDTKLDARLNKLPTLALAIPTLIEQYTPPKPAPSPSPSPSPAAKPPANVAALDQKTQSSIAMPAPNAQMEMSKDAQKPATSEMNKAAGNPFEKLEIIIMPFRPPEVKPSPTPPPRNPQMIVTELQRAAVLRAAYSERQLNEMLVDFWENHFSIYVQKDADRYMLTSFDRDVIRPFAFTRFRDLLGATAHSPAMLFYLDNWTSSVQRKYPATKDKPARTVGGINENYARELMELHTLGVDGGYTQKDVQEVARCFTGWTIRKPNEDGLFFFNPSAHDNGEKIVLGQKIPAGGGIMDGERVLDILARHPSTARFIATKLARRFISDNPPAEVINRAAEVFLKTDGSIKETLRAIITSPEFFSRPAYRAKTRSPFEYAVAALRALNAETDGDRPLLDWIARMGQPLYGRVTPDGYADRADQWLSTGALLNRFNFANALATNKIKGTRLDATRLLAGMDLNDAPAITARLTQIALGGDISPKTKDALERVRIETVQPNAQSVTTAVPPTATTNVNAIYARNAAAAQNATPAPPPPAVAQVITLVIGAPEFQQR